MTFIHTDNGAGTGSGPAVGGTQLGHRTYRTCLKQYEYNQTAIKICIEKLYSLTEMPIAATK